MHCTVCAAHSQGSEVAQGRQLDRQAAIQLIVVQVTAGGIWGEIGLRRGEERGEEGRGEGGRGREGVIRNGERG